MLVPPRVEIVEAADEESMRALGARLGKTLKAGEVVLLEGQLGAGKTTLVRGLLKGLGWQGEVRSPTFNLIQIYDTSPPVLHADLYRLAGATGLGLEDYWDTHLCLIEWPDRLGSLVDPDVCYRVSIEFDQTGEGRLVTISSPVAEG